MKRITALILTFLICFNISACKNKKAAYVDKLILEIGKVTIESKNKIDTAEIAFMELTDKEKKQVENSLVLTSAKTTYSKLLIDKVQNTIANIGQVSIEKEKVINDARNLYDNCPINIKSIINNYKVLESAEQELKQLKDQIKQEKIKAALSNLNSNIDEIEGITWYKSKNEPYYINTRSYILPYIGQDSSKVWLRLKYNYTGQNWIFFDSIIINIDGDKYEKSFNYFDIDRDNMYNVWETADVSPTNEDIEMLKKISSSTKTIVRFQGDNNHYDFIISSDDKNSIKEVLTAYETLK